jgi:hypothetical protein
MSQAKIIQPKKDTDQFVTITLTKSDLSKFLHKLHKENKKQIILEVTLPRKMIPQETQQ